MSTHAPSIFESINARALKPWQVARTFVASHQFTRLAKRNHAIIIGPRGSGKTTLLKMLQQPALEAWDDERADKFRSSIDYTGVFIATDLSWGAQVKALGDGKLDQESHRLLSKAAFTTHVLRSLITAMINRLYPAPNAIQPFRRAELSDADEVTLVREIGNAWHITPTIPSLLSLKHALSLRLSRIREIASSEVTRGENGRPERLGDLLFLHLHFIDAAGIAVEGFNDLTNDVDGVWALLFDELELAPEWIQDELIRSLRSTESKFLFKLAMSPFSPSAHLLEMKSGMSPTPDQDFEQIALWYVEKRDSIKFCQNLWNSMLQDRGIDAKTPIEVLGPSYFESYHEEWSVSGTAYSRDSRISQRFVSLAETDITFREYLKRKKINPKKLFLLPKGVMDSVVRKIAHLVALREFYRAPDRTGIRQIQKRTRKSAILYAGAESLFAVSEGNPRWFIAIAGRLLDNWQTQSTKIHRGSQAKEMLKAAERFSSMLRTIPVNPSKLLTPDDGVLELIETIGDFFHDLAVVRDFTAEPPSTFKVDNDMDEDVVIMLEQALNAGAIVYVPEDDSQFMITSVRGKRFRVSYLLAPLLGLPLRLGVETSLFRILRTSDRLVEKHPVLQFYPLAESDD